MADWYAKEVATGGDGSVGDPYPIDFAEADAVWKEATLAAGDNIYIMGDGTTAATIVPQDDGTNQAPITVQGRDAATGLVNTQITIGGGGTLAGPIFKSTTGVCDYWVWRNITAANTDKAAGSEGWLLDATGQRNHFFSCATHDCEYGWHVAAGLYNRFYNCWSYDNDQQGFRCNASDILFGCIAEGNGGHGFALPSTVIECLAYGNTGDGFSTIYDLLLGCAAHDNAIGINVAGNRNPHVLNCISTENATYGYQSTAVTAYLLQCAAYGNSSDEGNGAYIDNPGGYISCTVSPFVDAANGDFRLNNANNGGALCRQIARLSADGLWTGYPDLGAVDTKYSIDDLRVTALRPMHLRI